ncbi:MULTISPECIES: M10 family metallopeptidase C-terminal domain-containing protein [unclassified Pseudomonas]|uniref:M10 family metallopeptidase C-terminal domain-containing protein n=1 Tax=unclassified Pseudomonas TaxID=196821 RepID=UPI000BD9A676|nr:MULTISPECIES: glycosyl hydrolase family 28-related protein [unclassified Pseudomonas]PVZ13686.1 parallel beta-helix repeat protein [Pseudomonas sp. URIL14HWK12:I12]PVZ23992.1 parallel beta-helix repeat protein [Pseudomonas sp. URIL14HWK12:I10]PVZ33369.1 parallel beta-helix repeat protein [Pseudomonas sp. URIL14HWK12:I11]SNZ11315.1 parallel beta-helix repeat (two copies) [Pseudomonas sp. URIL14HWK12:I9]
MTTIYYNVRDYGAVGDGVTDDTAAIQAAISAAGAAIDSADEILDAQIYLPEGTYIVSGNPDRSAGSCLQLSSRMTLSGDGAGSTSIKLADGWDKAVTGIVRTSGETQHVGIHDLTLDGNRANTSGRVDGFTTGGENLRDNPDTNVTLSGVALINCSGNGLNAQENTYGLSVTDSVASGNGLDGFYAHLVGTFNPYVDAGGFQDNRSENNGRNGFTLVLDNYQTTLADNEAAHNGGRGILVQGPLGEDPDDSVQITGGEVYGNAEEGLLLKQTDFSRVSGVAVHDNGGAAIGLSGSSGNTLAGNTLYNNALTHGNAEVTVQASDDTDVTSIDSATGNAIYNNIISGGSGSYAVTERNEDRVGFNTVFDNYFSHLADPATVFHGTDSNAFGNHAGLVITGTGNSDTLNASDVADTLLYGGAGNDRLTGGAYEDLLYGGSGSDRLTGGAGADTFRYTHASDSVRGASDLITDFTPGEDKLDLASLGYSGLGDGHGGTLRLIYNASLDRTYLRSLDADASGHYFQLALAGNYQGLLQAADFETLLQGTGGKDTLSGTDADETLAGLAGRDTLNGGAGNDYLIGGASADRLTGGAGADTFVINTLHDSYANDSRGVDLSDTITDFDYRQDVLDLAGLGFTSLGSGHDGTLQATRIGSSDMVLQSLDADANGNYFKLLLENANYINDAAIRFGDPIATHFNEQPASYDDYYLDPPTSGNDVIVGYFSDDRISGLAGNDTLRGEAGNDTLAGNAGDDTLEGGSGNDTLSGGAGNDRLSGGSGDDTLIGGAGADTLSAGSGADTFRFTSSTDSLSGAHDLITDFTARQDVIDVAALGYTGLGDGTGGSLKVSYDAELDRTYVQNFTATSSGQHFEIALAGDHSRDLGTGQFIFAEVSPELTVLGV